MRKRFIFQLMAIIAILGYSQPGLTQGIQQKLYVIDQSIDHYQTLANSLSTEGQSFILPVDGNPLAHVKNFLSVSDKQYNELHLYVHAKEGAVGFNALTITLNEIDKQSGLLASFKNLLAPSCTILIHGNPGFEWINRFQSAVGLEVSSVE